MKTLFGLVALLVFVGCGQVELPPQAKPTPTKVTTQTWSNTQAVIKFQAAQTEFSDDLEVFYRLIRLKPKPPVAAFAIQCQQVLPKLASFAKFLRDSPWPPNLSGVADRLFKQQLRYNNQLESCSRSLTKKKLAQALKKLSTSELARRVALMQRALVIGSKKEK